MGWFISKHTNRAGTQTDSQVAAVHSGLGSYTGARSQATSGCVLLDQSEDYGTLEELCIFKMSSLQALTDLCIHTFFFFLNHLTFNIFSVWESQVSMLLLSVTYSTLTCTQETRGIMSAGNWRARLHVHVHVLTSCIEWCKKTDLCVCLCQDSKGNRSIERIKAHSVKVILLLSAFAVMHMCMYVIRKWESR